MYLFQNVNLPLSNHNTRKINLRIFLILSLRNYGIKQSPFLYKKKLIYLPINFFQHYKYHHQNWTKSLIYVHIYLSKIESHTEPKLIFYYYYYYFSEVVSISNCFCYIFHCSMFLSLLLLLLLSEGTLTLASFSTL